MTNQATRLLLLAFITGYALPSLAEKPRLLELRTDREMSAELKAALADVLAPDSYDAELIRSMSGAVPVEAVAMTRPLPVDLASTCESLQANAPECARTVELTAGTVGSVMGHYDGSHFVSAGSYYVLTKDSELLRPYGGEAIADRAEKTAGLLVKVPGQADLASKAPSSWWSGLWRDTSRADIFDISEPSPMEVNPKVASVLKQVELDLREQGFSSRMIEIPSGSSDEDIARLQHLASDEGILASSPEDKLDSSVEIDYPSGSVVQTATMGRCTGAPEDWPYDKDEVRSVLARNAAVLQHIGVTPTHRSNTVVIDSGVSAALVRHPRFLPFLVRNSILEINPPIFTKTPQGDSACWSHGSRPSMASYGYVVQTAAKNICVGTSSWDALAPPKVVPNQSNYLPDHGGVVATVAMGGPDLLDIQELHRWIGVSFVKVMRSSGSRVMSDASDVAEAITYAREQGATIVTASLKIRDGDFDFLSTPIQNYWNNGLVVASAGNSGGQLAMRSGSFPASVSSGSDQAGIIIVGGVMPTAPENPMPQFWGLSAWSKRLVDIGAPATHIKSFDSAANEACYEGTSVAAPQISFAAAVIASLGIPKPILIKRRLLATAHEYTHLESRFRNGRVLNLPLALDVFTDLLWIDDADKPPLRVELLPPEKLLNGGTVIRACTSTGILDGSAGWIDPAQLLYWHRRSGTEAEVWFESSGGAASALDARCDIPNGKLRYLIRTATGTSEFEVDMSRVMKIVPTRLRSAVRAGLTI